MWTMLSLHPLEYGMDEEENSNFIADWMTWTVNCSPRVYFYYAQDYPELFLVWLSSIARSCLLLIRIPFICRLIERTNNVVVAHSFGNFISLYRLHLIDPIQEITEDDDNDNPETRDSFYAQEGPINSCSAQFMADMVCSDLFPGHVQNFGDGRFGPSTAARSNHGSAEQQRQQQQQWINGIAYRRHISDQRQGRMVSSMRCN